MEDEVAEQATSTSVDIDQGALESELAKTLAAPAKDQPSVASELVRVRHRVLSIRTASHRVQETRGMAVNLSRLLQSRRQHLNLYKYQDLKDNHTRQEQHRHLTSCSSCNR